MALALLQVLDLSHNRLVSVRGLERCANLRELRLGHNALQSLEPLAGLSQLQVGTGVGVGGGERLYVPAQTLNRT